MQKTVSTFYHTKKQVPRVIIVGGGFAGVRCALDLHKKLKEKVAITLISKHAYFEYYPAMYRVVAGGSITRVSIPLKDIFKHTTVEVVSDEIVHSNPLEKEVTGNSGCVYKGDYLLFAMGSQNNFFNIEGVDEISYNFQSTREALRLKKRIRDIFEKQRAGSTDEALLALHIVIAGAGPSGVEVAGLLAEYTRTLATQYAIAESLVTINLIDRGPRVLSRLPEKISHKVEARLRTLGVHLLLNRNLIKSESWTVFLQDMTIGSRTVIWTAGTAPHTSSQNIPGFFYTERGKIVVDSYLQAKGCDHVFVAGDIADTPYSGLAQTALHNGQSIAKVIIADISGLPLPHILPRENAFDIPVGSQWGVFAYKNIHIYGRMGLWIRHMIDLAFYASIVPFSQAWKIFLSAPTSPEEDESFLS